MNIVVTLDDNKGKQSVTIDVGNKGVNGDVTKRDIMPIVLKELGYEGATFYLTGFRYYLGTCIYKLTVSLDGQLFKGHMVNSWTNSKICKIN